MVSRHKYLIGVGQLDEPVEKTKHFPLCSIVCEVTAMHDNIRRRKPFQLPVSAMCVRDLEDSHICIIREDVASGLYIQSEHNRVVLFHPFFDTIVDAFLEIFQLFIRNGIKHFPAFPHLIRLTI